MEKALQVTQRRKTQCVCIQRFYGTTRWYNSNAPKYAAVFSKLSREMVRKVYDACIFSLFGQDELL